MKTLRRSMPLVCLAMAVLACALSPLAALAQDDDALARDIAGELRRTKSRLFSGRYADVFEALGAVDVKLAHLQRAAPGHKELPRLVKEFADQKRKVEQKLGKTLPVKTKLTVPEAAPVRADAGKSPGAGPAASGKPAPLPYDARYPMEQFQRQHASFERNAAAYESADMDYRKSLVGRMDNNVAQLEENLDRARELAAKKGVTAHPSFDEAQRTLEADKTRLSGIRERHGADVAAAAVRSQAVEADAETLTAEYARLRDTVFSKATGFAPHYNDPSELEPLAEVIETFEATELEGLRRRLADFASKYGATRQEIDRNTGEQRAAGAFESLKNGIENVQKTRTVMAEDLLERYRQGLANLSAVHDFFKVAAAKNLKRYLDLATRFAPGHEGARAAMEAYPARIDDALEGFYRKIDERTWPGHGPKAPSNAAALAKAALAWFAEDEGWGQRDKNPRAKDKEARRPLTVAVKGPWSVQKRNILGEPIMYGLPVLVAVEVRSEKALNLVRVYDLTLRTDERRGIAMAPPFASVTVGNSWYIRPSALR